MSEKLIGWYKINYAIQAKPGITSSELADKCETTERTIYRDMITLTVLAPITNVGYGKGYSFVGNYAIYPFSWTEQESFVISMLPSVIDISKLPPGFDSAYDKLMAAHVKQKTSNKEVITKCY